MARCRAAGHAVVGASAVSAASRERVEVMLPGVPVLEVPQVVERAELVLLTVPDDALAGLVSGLAATGAWQPGQLVVHTSGRFGWRVLDPAVALGAIPLAVHPAMTFTGTSLDLSRLTDCCFGVTAPNAVLPIAQALVVEMGAEPVVVAEEQRPLIPRRARARGESPGHAGHAGAATAAGGGGGTGRPGAGPAAVGQPGQRPAPGDEALTGPVSRGDAGTVAVHLAALAGSGVPDAPATYRALARTTADRALASGRLRAQAAEALLAVLAEGNGGGPAL